MSPCRKIYAIEEYTPVVCRLGTGAVFCGLAFCGIIVVGGWIIVISWFGGLVIDCERTLPLRR